MLPPFALISLPVIHLPAVLHKNPTTSGHIFGLAYSCCDQFVYPKVLYSRLLLLSVLLDSTCLYLTNKPSV